MNILFFSRLFCPHIGGVERHVLEISRILIKKGHRIAIVTEQHSRDLKIKESIEGTKVYRIPNLKEGKNKKFQIWKWLWENRGLIGNSDVIHCHDVFFWYLPFRFIFPFKRVFTTFHGYESYPLKRKDILIHKISEKLSNGNICVGDFIRKWHGAKPNFVIYGAAEIPNQESLSKNKIKDESAVFIGRLHEQTGILTYVKAVQLLKKRIPDFDFLAIGDGELKDVINRKVKVLDAMNNPQRYFQRYNFAFVSRYLSILEAMAAKRLVFAVYDNPIKEDYLKMAPFSECITISNSSSELVSKILFYLEDLEARRKMTEKAYVWVKKRTWREVVKTYLALWGI